MLRFLFDVHVPLAVANQLELRGVDILTAQADNSATLQDQDILVRATELGRVMFTSDIRFRALAETWQQSQRTFHGLVFAHPLHVTVGQMVLHLELIASAVSEEEIRNHVIYLPL